jgi:hypothetical protein
VGQTVGAPYAPQLGIASVEISIALAAQRSGSARAASSGPTALPQPRQAELLPQDTFTTGIHNAVGRPPSEPSPGIHSSCSRSRGSFLFRDGAALPSARTKRPALKCSRHAVPRAGGSQAHRAGARGWTHRFSSRLLQIEFLSQFLEGAARARNFAQARLEHKIEQTKNEKK